MSKISRIRDDKHLKYQLQREELVESSSLTFWDVTCVGGGKWGSVSYDLDGKELGIKTLETLMTMGPLTAPMLER